MITSIISNGQDEPVGGSAHLLIPSLPTLRLTLVSPSTLTAHLAQSTLRIDSIGMLNQLLDDEVCAALLRGVREVGEKVFEEREGGGSWFVDLKECVGRWEGGVLWVFLFFLVLVSVG